MTKIRHRFAKHTEAMGIPEHDASQLRDDFLDSRSEASEHLQAAVTCETAVRWLARMAGESSVQDAGNLVQLGKVLATLSEEGVPLTGGDQKLISLGLGLIEKALESGKLIDLHGRAAAEVAFLVNRIAKSCATHPDIKGINPEFLSDLSAKAYDFATGLIQGKKEECKKQKQGAVVKRKVAIDKRAHVLLDREFKEQTSDDDDREELLSTISATIQALDTKLVELNKQLKHLEELHADCEVGNRGYRNFSSESAAKSLYFIKNILMASEMLRQGEPLFKSVSRMSAGLKFDGVDAKETIIIFGDATKKARDTWHIFHVKPEVLLFFKFVVEYLRQQKNRVEEIK